MTKEELIAEITGLLGGRSSEEVFCKDISTGASNDIERATKIARAMVVEYGMSSLGPVQYESNGGSVFLGRDYTSNQKNFANQIANEIDKEVRKIIDQAHEAAIKIINERKDDVILIAETLLEVETLNGEEIDYLLENRKLPDYAEKKVEEANATTSKQVESKETTTEVEAKEVEEKHEEPTDAETSSNSKTN
jgi:cell division protease FtsH